ncbi:MAG: hypothetical protein JWR01_2205 [Subtercola sp.]|nr:hypothetical protein [Subtercola sp.]
MRELKLSVDYGMGWPLSDIMWWPEDQPDWPSLITPQLDTDLRAWGDFFNKWGDHETGLFGSEERRKWFDLEGFRLRDELDKQVGHLYTIKLQLWF